MKPKSFGVKLWLYFAFFTAVIFCILWLLQIVFLQSFYNSMVIKNIKKAAEQISEKSYNGDMHDIIDSLAYNNSLLIFLTDENGNTIYSADEHANLYEKHNSRHNEDSLKNNPYYDSNVTMNWQIGALRNLPTDYEVFLQKLSESNNKIIEYQTENGSSYVYGKLFSEDWSLSNNLASNKTILYISSALEAVGGTVDILKIQLIWTTIISLIIGIVIAFFTSRKFSKPVKSISIHAKNMAEGRFECNFEKGFCSEIDELADTLNVTGEKLERADEFRRELLANISHDLRTPLTMIKGYAEAVKEFSWEDKNEREADLEVIIRESDRLTDLVNDILEYSSLRAGSLNIEYEKVDISVLIQNVESQFSLTCRNKGCEIQSLIEPGQMVYGNEKFIERVLYNLIDNAITHSLNNSKIMIALKQANNNIRIEIRDFGKGISENELPYIWDRYFTLKQCKRNNKGSGLGLAISKEILLAHNADFGVESKTGKGSMFWFELKKV